MIHTAISQIKKHLSDEIECFRDLLTVVEQERDILLEGKHENLMSLSQRKLELSQKLAQTQNQRRRLMEGLSPNPKEPLRLSDLSRHLPKEERSSFRDLVRILGAMAKRLATMNQLNKGFVEEALDTVEHLLGILTASNRNQCYSAQGSSQAPNLPRLLAREV
ncbi:MAG: flagellar protein FlgN [Desulfarculaceae bacterium]|jgi:flagellar biosynthesis/type III secretory pathway chaperone